MLDHLYLFRSTHRGALFVPDQKDHKTTAQIKQTLSSFYELIFKLKTKMSSEIQDTVNLCFADGELEIWIATFRACYC